MKDITDYFTSPTLKTDFKPAETKDLSLVVVVDEVDNGSDDKPTNSSKVLVNIENSTKGKTIDVSNKSRKKKDKKHKRKPSDPAVKSITELLSNNLNIISPNSSFTKSINSAETTSALSSGAKSLKSALKKCSLQSDNGVSPQEDQFIKKDTDNINDTLVLSDESLQDKCSENRTGENEIAEQQPTGKLNAFKFMMESRNKIIGQNSLGKDLPENDDRTGDNKNYKEKLSTRKHLLHKWAEKKGASKRKRNEEEKDEFINHKLNKRAKRLKKLLQVDSHDEEDVILKKRKRRRVKIASSSSESSADAVAIIENPEENFSNSVLDIVEENAQDHLLNESKSKESKQGLLSFLGVVNKTNNANECSNDKSNSEKKNRKICRPKVEKRKSRLSLKKKEEPEMSKDCINLDECTSEQPIIMEKLKTPNRKKNVNESSQESIEHPETPKTKILGENEESLTPGTLRSWKMKIKINTDDIERTAKNVINIEENRPVRTTRNKSVIYKEQISDENSNKGKPKTTQKQKQTLHLNEMILSSEDEDNSKDSKADTYQSRRPAKIAPVFVKATPKPKLAPEFLEAKKQFLMSGIPTSLKRAMEKQQSYEEKYYEVFPSTSHVQQKCETQSFWNLSKPQLNLKECSPLKSIEYELCKDLTNSYIVRKLNIHIETEKVDNLKTLLNKIKTDNPNYPVYKSFRLIYDKSGKISEKQNEETPKRGKSKKRRNKNLNKNSETIELDKQENYYIEHAMWTDKYKPKCSDDIIGNTQAVNNLKKWLQIWMNFSQEINAKKKRRRNSSTSESEFDTTDCDSKDSTKLPGNTVILGGPCGSGKSVSVYALCNELGFNVIELNSSTKRTGKRLLQELQEATQSHQVRKGDKNNFFQANKPKETSESKEQPVDKRMCVLLVEDVDLVFEQDDGFISALTQLVNTSKRPIVMTTTDSSSIYVQKFVSQYEYISFLPLSSQSLATWLQIVCLVEGLLVNQSDIGSLLEYNRGDIRKTLLQLQFWVQSGGQIIRDKIPVKIVNTRTSTEKMSDDEQPLSYVEDKNDNQSKKKTVFSHSNCIGSFEIFRDHKQYYIPYYLNLGLIWWNIPNILNMPNFSHKRRCKFSEDGSDRQLEADTFKEKSLIGVEEKTKLNLLARLYDSLVFTDVSFRKIQYFDGIEPIVKNYSIDLKDSLELGECMDCYNGNSDFAHEITHTLVNGYIGQYNAIEKNESTLNMSVPERAERRWRAKHHVCEDVFQEALSLSNYVDRKSKALDYMPSLRNISRLESLRAANNTKRGKRFRNYLRNLNINYNDNTVKLACNILTTDEF